MIELYGNKIWNSNTPNKYKKVIIASEDSLDNICQELENSGLNYCAYIFNGEAHIAIGRATANNIDKLDIDYQTVIECNSKVYKTNNIIGTTTYDSIEDKLYRKYNTDFAYKIGQRLTEQGILFSGRIYGKTTTITVDKQYADTLNKISAELKEQRASFMSKSEVVQNESPEESKSVNEKISELHFNESQLSALAPSVKFIQTRNDDNLTDNFVSLFSDCTDFYESQLSALAEIYVDTYRSFSDKSLIFADTSRFNDLKQRFVNDNITAKLTENRGYSTTQFEIIREMVTYGMSESVINLLDYTFSIDEMQNFFTAYKNGSYEDLINLIADIKGTTRTDIEGQIEGGTYTPEIPDYDFLSKNLIFHNPSANHFTVMYFNPDSETGGQFVSTDINYNVAWRGNRDFTNDSERFWRYVEITGNQTLSDVGSKFFRESLNYFYSGEQIAEGLTTDTQKLIADVATAEMIKSGELIEPESFDVAKFDTLISEQKEITSNNSDKNTIVINAFAGPGAGKTTSCLEVAEKLKKQGFVTEYVQEYAKELVYDNNLIMLDGHYEHQFAILNEQMKRINRLYGKVDFIVTDSPILLNNTYLNEDKNTEVYSAYSDSVNKLYGLYNNFNYFVERDTSVFEKEGRIHNLEQSIAIDNELKNMLHNNQIDFDVYTHATIDNIVRDSTIIYAKQLINSYCQDEFDSEADFSDLKKVGVAYTTTEDSKHTVEAVVNLVDYRLETYVDDKLFKEETYADLKDMIDNCLHSLSFDDLVYLSDEELAPFYEEHDELDDVDPAVIRQQLEDAGIVNGELVDEDKLNSDPFIQQVMADAETDAERNFYQNNFDIKVRNYAGALKVSSEEIVNQFNSESEAVPVNEPEQGNIRPTITCDWSESPVFENGKTYSVSEFDTLMKNADDEWVEQRQLEIEEYGSENAVAEAYRNGELDNIHLGYEKTKFIVNMPNGTTHTFRQDIGDGDGGVIDFLKQYPQYSGVVKILEADIKLDKGENEKAADLPITESKEREVRSDEKLQSVDELAVEVENAAPSRAEKAEVTVVNKAEPPTLFDMVESSEQTETSVNDEKAKNYVIEDREAVTGAKTKFQNNIAAIKILKQTEAENRAATPEEQGQLSLYSGWGGLANAFESDNDKWKNEYSELKGLLTDEEYTAARSTVLDSFYTDTAIVDSIYEVIRNAGFEDGNILEPAMGVGNFFGRLPEELRDKVNLYGVEKDSLSGRIAQKLYPQADITIDGFENTRFNDNSFDVAIGNIPFGDFSVNDSKYNSEHLKIHDYFFLKSLDKVRDGGIVAFVTSKGTLDKKDSSFRKTLAERADLVGAVRLPNNAFKSAGTEVTPDIIFLQKRSAPLENIPSWVNVGTTENGLSINNYFIEHPEMVLGNIVQGNKLYGRTDDTMCVPFADGRPLSELLPEAVKHITFTYSPAKEVISPVSKAEAVISKPEELRSQSYYKSGNEIYFYGSNSAGELVTVSAKDLLDKKYTTKNIDRLTAFMEIRDTLRELLEVQQHDNNDAEVEQLQHRLNTIYDNFYDKYGLIHSRYNRNILGFDGAYQLVASLEQDYDKNTLIKKSDIFTQRVNVPKPQIEHIDTASEALAVCIAEKGYIDFDYMSNLTDIDKASLEESLRNNGEIYPIPMNTENNEYTYQTASEYLSGDIYAKLDTAESYAAVDNIYSANVTALKAALPTPLKAGDIDVNLGATWIAPEYYEQFMYKLFETPLFNRSDGIFKDSKISVEYSEYSGKWFISHKSADKSVTVTKTYGACGYSGYQILEAALNLSEPKVYKDKLVATKDDFKAENRKRLMSKIATGNYDAVIIGHTQLKMLPLSPERQENIFKEQIDNIVAGIAELKYQEGNSFKVKDMERTKRSLEQQLEKLQSSKKDNTVYFEELGIDKLFVDEAHEFKNLFCTTKLQNVSGISSRASQRATELFAKCRYLDEKTGGKGVVFATGTPLSNSVTELHTMMRYLNYDFLASHNNMQNFDNWVSTFGVQKKEYELAPAGNKFKERTRIAEYANLPELMSMFKTIADVRTADTLNLKVPDCELHIVDVEPTELQTELVEELSDRADEVNNGSVDPSQDNMLKITGDGRKLGLDPRLINPSFEDDPGTKLNVCVNNVFDIYEKTSDKKLTQIVFCDLGVPSKNSSADGNKDDDTKSVAELDSLEESGKFCVYDDIRDKLIAKGVSADEIAYIHNAKSETQKSELFAKVRSGEVRILLGSTGKMGTGTNVQDRIIALHDLDVPWRPSDLEQRRGRMVRQGNINDKVHLYRYVTKGTFDAYSYQLLEKKQKFISQIMTSKEPGRKCADVDQAALTYSEIKALCTGDERIREKLTLENRVKELQALKSEYNSTRYELEDKVNAYPEERKKLLLDIGNISKDMETVKNIPFDVKTESYRVGITIGKDAYSLLDDESRKVAAKALTNAVAQVKGDANKNKRIAIGGLGNFGVEIINDGYFLDKITATLRGNYTYSVELGVSSIINLKKIENLLFKVENVLNDKKSELNKLDIDYKTAQNMLHKPFEFEDELNNSTKRLDELTTALNIDMSEHKVDKPKKTHYFGKDFILGKNKSSKQIQNNEVMKSEPKRSEQEL